MDKKQTFAVFVSFFLIIFFAYGEKIKENINEQLTKAESLLSKEPLHARQIAKIILKEVKLTESPGITFNALLIEAASHIILNENNKALEILSECEKIKSQFALGDFNSSFYKYQGTVHAKLSNYVKALEYYYKFLSSVKKGGKEAEVGIAYNNIGLVFIYLGNYEKALANLYETRKIMAKLNNKAAEAKVLNNIGICQTELKNYKSSLEYYTQSLKIKEELGDEEGIGNALNNIGQTYFYLNDMEESLRFTKRAEKIAIDLNNKKRMASVFTNMGRIYMKKGEMERGEKYLLNSVKIKMELNDKWEIAFTLKILSELYMNMGDNGKALTHAEKSLELSRKIGSNKLTSEILLMISDIQKNQGNYRQSLKSYSEHTKTREKFINKKSRDKIEELKISNEIEKMEHRIKFLEKENELKSRDIVNQKEMQRLFILLSLMLFSVLVLIYFAYKTKSGSNKKLLILNTTLEDRSDELEKALFEVRTLTGLLPVCSSCKKVRDKDNKWNPMEEYIKEYSEASVTHTLCPDCKDNTFKGK